jgi:hypothetical protein
LLSGTHYDASDGDYDAVTRKAIVILVTLLCHSENVSVSYGYRNDGDDGRHDGDGDYDDDDDDDKLKNGRHNDSVPK